MNKRLISLALAALLLAMTAFPVTALGTTMGGEGSTWHAYVRTSNGKGLNLRDGPGTDYKVITTIPYGKSVHLNDYIDKTWVEVDYGSHHGYVMGRYLTYTEPSPYKPTPKPTTKPSSGSGTSTTSLKKLFQNFTFVSYTAQVRPSTPGGFVHMRWAPTKASDPIRDFHQNDILTVIAQDSTWAQVVDPNTGITGFMMRSFLTDLGVGQADPGES